MKSSDNKKLSWKKEVKKSFIPTYVGYRNCAS